VCDKCGTAATNHLQKQCDVCGGRITSSQVAADCVQRTGVFGKVAELQGMGVLQEMSEVVVAIP